MIDWTPDTLLVLAGLVVVTVVAFIIIIKKIGMK